MTGRKIMVFIFIISLLFSVYPVKAFCLWGNLKSKIQSELDQNPFLVKEKLKLRVTEEKNGYVTLELYEGNRGLRNDIYKDGGIIFNPLFNERNKLKAAGILKNTVEYIKTIEGVKAVSLTAAINTPEDQSADFLEQAVNLWKENKYAVLAVG